MLIRARALMRLGCLAAFLFWLGKKAALLLRVFSGAWALLRERLGALLLVLGDGFFQSFFCAFVHRFVNRDS